MSGAAGELLPLLLVLAGGVAAGFWPGWTLRGWHAERAEAREMAADFEEQAQDAAWEAEFTSIYPGVLASTQLDELTADQARLIRWAGTRDDSGHAPVECPAMTSAALELGYPHECTPALRAPWETEAEHEWHDHAPLTWEDEGVSGCPACEARWEIPHPPPPPAPRPDEETERPATIAEIAQNAEYRLAWGELSSLAESAYDWYDETFQTGQFRKIEP